MIVFKLFVFGFKNERWATKITATTAKTAIIFLFQIKIMHDFSPQMASPG